jgi:hypothetical protein
MGGSHHQDILCREMTDAPILESNFSNQRSEITCNRFTVTDNYADPFVGKDLHPLTQHFVYEHPLKCYRRFFGI